MTADEAREEIRRLVAVFSSLRNWIEKQPDKETLRVAWCGQLGRCHREDVAAVVDQMINGDVSLPENYNFDRTALMIRQLASERRAKIVDQERIASMRRPRATLHPNVEKALRDFRANTAPPKPIRNQPVRP